MRTFYLVLMLSAVASAGAAAQENRPPLIEGVLDFSASEGEDTLADAFFEQVNKHAGQIVELKLKIVPVAAENYHLAATRPIGADTDDEPNDVPCFGLLENMSDAYVLTFNHPQHFHAPTTIVIGPRLEFPRQSAKCNVADPEAPAPLDLSGFYLIDQAEIPTAVQNLLVPVNP